uniref:Uncharacterized protein n=1 Tax=Anopheles funestus TaxID=62324 RepID=A0A7M5EAU1_ANOFN
MSPSETSACEDLKAFERRADRSDSMPAAPDPTMEAAARDNFVGYFRWCILLANGSSDLDRTASGIVTEPFNFHNINNHPFDTFCVRYSQTCNCSTNNNIAYEKCAGRVQTCRVTKRAS